MEAVAAFLNSPTLNWIMGILGGMVGLFVAAKIVVPGAKYM